MLLNIFFLKESFHKLLLREYLNLIILTYLWRVQIVKKCTNMEFNIVRFPLIKIDVEISKSPPTPKKEIFKIKKEEWILGKSFNEVRIVLPVINLNFLIEEAHHYIIMITNHCVYAYLTAQNPHSYRETNIFIYQ